MKRGTTSLMAVALLGAVALAGCGDKGDNNTADAGPSVTVATPAGGEGKPNSEASEAPEVSATASVQPNTRSEEDQKQVEAAQSEVVKSLAENPPSVAPVEGKPADETDAKAISAVEKRMVTGNNIDEFIGNMEASLCKSYLESPEIQNVIMAMKKVGADGLTDPASRPVPEVSDVRVDGDEASATVSTVALGQKVTMVHRYVKEDGEWKLCTEKKS